MNQQLQNRLNPINGMAIRRKFFKLLGIMTPQIYLILMLTLFVAAWSWQSNLETLTTIEASHAQQRQIELRKTPVSESELAVVVGLIARLHDKAKVSVVEVEGKKALRIEMESTAQMDAFREQLVTAQNSTDGVIWAVEQFCMGECRGPKGVVVLSGFRQTIEAK